MVGVVGLTQATGVTSVERQGTTPMTAAVVGVVVAEVEVVEGGPGGWSITVVIYKVFALL